MIDIAGMTGREVVAVLKGKKMTDKQIAEAIGVKTAAVWRWKKGLSQPRKQSLHTLKELARRDQDGTS